MERPEPDAFLGEVFFALAKNADTPVALSCWLMYKYREFDQLVRKEINPHEYICRATFRKDYLVVKYLSKHKTLATGIDTEAAALNSWRSSEEKCRLTNQRIRQARLRGFSPRVEAVIFTAKRKIASLIGPCSLNRLFSECRWGPGSTFTLKGEEATLGDKIREYPISVTPRALPYIKAVIEADPHWAEAMLHHDVDGPFSLLPTAFRVVSGCRATLVDKNAKTKRSIAIEPTGNIFLQLGIGRYLRRKLKARGIDLDDQSLNQALAEEGSRTGRLATLDLSAASDTVSTELVAELFPIDWFLLLDQLRSPFVHWKGSDPIKVEKFSSMGNGFTFELESLIFWALASGVLEVEGSSETVGVYGDDIIIDTTCAPLLTEVLETLGFSLNKEKSFVSSYFRESCGKHYWDGEDVTPVYQKDPVNSLPEAYRFSNRLLRYAYRHNGVCGTYLADWVRAAWLSSHRGAYSLCARKRLGVQVPERSLEEAQNAFRKRGHVVPFGDDCDDGLLLPLRQIGPFVLAVQQDGGTSRYKLPVLSFRSKKKNFFERSLLAYLLRFGADEPFNGRVSIRRRGKWVTRRRWFAPALFTPRSTLDVEWETLE